MWAVIVFILWVYYVFTWIFKLLVKIFITCSTFTSFTTIQTKWQTWITGYVSWKKLDKLKGRGGGQSTLTKSTLIAYKWHLFKASFPVKVAFSLEGNKFPSQFILFYTCICLLTCSCMSIFYSVYVQFVKYLIQLIVYYV